jgi:amino-acid N-acetyltransferase
MPTQLIETLRQAFSYVDRYRGRLFVITIDDSLLSHHYFPLLVRDIALLHRMGIRIALVPGARNHISRLLRRFGVRWTTHNDVRITRPEAMRYVKLAASDAADKLVSLLSEHGVDTTAGNWTRARAIGVHNGVDYHNAGTVESIQTTVVSRMLEDGVVPLFTTIGWGPRGVAYNVSAHHLAVAVSRELQAAKLFFLVGSSTVPRASSLHLPTPAAAGVRDDGTVSNLSLELARGALDGTPRSRWDGNSRRLVEFAAQACSEGVPRAHIVDGRVQGALLQEIFSNQGSGLMIYANEHSNVRAMTRTDIPDVERLMQPAIESGRLLPRSQRQLEQHLEEYVLYEVDGTLHGCAALHRYPGKQAEIAALVVDEEFASAGTGRHLVSYLLTRARAAGMRRVFALTTQATDWFANLGFRPAKPADLPPARRALYDRRRNSRVLVCDVPRAPAASTRLAVE